MMSTLSVRNLTRERMILQKFCQNPGPSLHRNTKRGAGLLLLLLAATACGEKSHLDGTVGGTEFGSVKSAFFMTSSTNLYELQLVLTNFEDGCASYESYFVSDAQPEGNDPAHALFVRFQLLETATLGAYEIVPNNETYESPLEFVHAWFRTYEGEGWTAPSEASAQTGSIVINTFSPTDAEEGLVGTVEVNLITGDSLEGNFVAGYCNISDF